MDLHVYAKIIKEFKLSEEKVNEKCSYNTILKVHKEITEWRNTVPYLFSPEKEEDIVERIRQDRTLDEVGRRRRLLNLWKEFHGSDATYKKLIEAFLSTNRRDLAENVCEVLSGGELHVFNHLRPGAQNMCYLRKCVSTLTDIWDYSSLSC